MFFLLICDNGGCRFYFRLGNKQVHNVPRILASLYLFDRLPVSLQHVDNFETTEWKFMKFDIVKF